LPPSGRSGHSAVWDGADRLVVYGGSGGGGDPEWDAHVWVLTLGNRHWARQRCAGAQPGPRAGHVVVMLRPDAMLLFGGLSPQVLPEGNKTLALMPVCISMLTVAGA